MSFFDKIKSALANTSKRLAKIGDIFSRKSLDQNAIDDLEEILLSADFGMNTTSKIIEQLKNVSFEQEEKLEHCKSALEKIIFDILKTAQKPLLLDDGKLNVILFCGVNGNGKTTTIAKLSHLYCKLGEKVVIAACDTFRSAAVDQLAVWANRIGCEMISGSDSDDPASVAYNAMQHAIGIKADILIIDTAGRLHNKQNLMEELTKILRVIKKCDASAPHHVILTLDANTGQNAFNQVEKFTSVANVTGLIFTKLDGTAKGGAIVGITEQYNLPIHYITIGEGVEDIEEFDPERFANALIS